MRPLPCPPHSRSVIQDENEGAAKKGLAVLTEMWRRHVWRDARTVNVIAAAGALCANVRRPGDCAAAPPGQQSLPGPS